MRELHCLQANAAGAYRRGAAVPNQIEHVVDHSLTLLKEIRPEPLGTCDGKEYHFFRAGTNASRPVRLPLLIRNSELFRQGWYAFHRSARPEERRYDLPCDEIDTLLYSASMAFAICYDLWKPASRKTPGTFFEVMLGTVMQSVLPSLARISHRVADSGVE